MNDHLARLLHDESGRLDVPPAPAGEIITQGRRRRRRTRAGVGVAGLAGLAIVAGGVLGSGSLLGGPDPGTGGDGTGRDLSAASAAYEQQGAFAVGRTVYFGTSGEHAVDVPADVKQLYYTSAGVLVRSGRSPWTDSRGGSDYGLVTPDGEVRSLGVRLGDVAPDTSADAPYLAWASPGDSATSWTVHVLDVRTSQDTTLTVTGAFTWGGWDAPPVSIDGGLVYVGLDEATVAVDVRTGEQQVAEGMARSYYPDVVNGLVLAEPPRDRRYQPTGPARVVEALSGSVVRSIPVGVDDFLTLSPDGRFVRVADQGYALEGEARPPATRILDVATGQSLTLDSSTIDGFDYGWTPDGGLIRVTRDSASLCEPGGSPCREVAQDLGPGVIKIGGNSYES